MSYRDQLIDAEELIEELEKKNKGLEATLERVKKLLASFPIWEDKTFQTSPSGVFYTIFWDKDRYFKTLEDWRKLLEEALK